MIWLIIISGFGFVIGNVIWPLFNEPKLFYVPLAVHLLALVFNSLHPAKVDSWHKRILLRYFVIMAMGNLVKQIFYNPQLKQINDYVLGGLATLILIIIILNRWATRKITPGGRK